MSKVMLTYFLTLHLLECYMKLVQGLSGPIRCTHIGHLTQCSLVWTCHLVGCIMDCPIFSNCLSGQDF